MLKSSFLEYLRAELNRSARTVESYELDLRQFESFFESLGEGLTWETVTADVVREWAISLMDEDGVSARSVARKFSALRTFYMYLARCGRVSSNPMEKIVAPKREKKLPVFVREEDMDRLFARMADSDDGSFECVRDLAVLMFFYHTGMRRAELLGLRDVDIDMGSATIKVTGKRNKQRVIPFGAELRAVIERYVAVRDKAFEVRCGLFFLWNDGSGLTENQVEKIVKSKLSMVTNLSKRSPHVLRHTFATVMLNHDADLEAIKKVMGHESLSTTQIYTHLTFEELKKVYKGAHPRSE